MTKKGKKRANPIYLMFLKPKLKPMTKLQFPRPALAALSEIQRSVARAML